MLQSLLILFAAGAVGGLTIGKRIAIGEIKMMRMLAKTGVRRRNKKWEEVKANFKRNDRWNKVKASYRQNPFWDRTKDIHKSYIADARRRVEDAQARMKDFKKYDAAKLKVKTWRMEIDKKEKARREKWQKIKDNVKEWEKYRISADYLLGIAEEKPQERELR
ncbi:MAG: hypothetical protein QXJ68_04845 [Methanocellales archaeon]